VSDDSGNRYKMFRNFMVNELGLRREDLEEWAKESVAEEVRKFIESSGGMEKLVVKALQGRYYGDIREDIRVRAARLVADHALKVLRGEE